MIDDLVRGLSRSLENVSRKFRDEPAPAASARNARREPPARDSSPQPAGPSWGECVQAAEDAIRRMIVGVFQFIFWKFPYWTFRWVMDVAGPEVIRVTRLTAVFLAWLALLCWPAILVIPAILAAKAPGEDMTLFIKIAAAVAWLLLAISGSIWGYCCIRRKRLRPPAAPAVREGSRDGAGAIQPHGGAHPERRVAEPPRPLTSGR